MAHPGASPSIVATAIVAMVCVALAAFLWQHTLGCKRAREERVHASSVAIREQHHGDMLDLRTDFGRIEASLRESIGRLEGKLEAAKP